MFANRVVARWLTALLAWVVASVPAAAQTATAVQVFAAPPAGWIKKGSHPDDYHMGIDAVYRSGKGSGAIKAKGDGPRGFGTLMQTFQANSYREKRLRLSGYVKAENVLDWAGLWMRIDGENKMLGFDNMMNRKITGTSDWKKYEIVLDVPKDSINVAFGILLSGKGQVWMDDLRFDTVGKEVATTQLPDAAYPSVKPAELKLPVYLDFE